MNSWTQIEVIFLFLFSVQSTRHFIDSYFHWNFDDDNNNNVAPFDKRSIFCFLLFSLFFVSRSSLAYFSVHRRHTHVTGHFDLNDSLLFVLIFSFVLFFISRTVRLIILGHCTNSRHYCWHFLLRTNRSKICFSFNWISIRSMSSKILSFTTHLIMIILIGKYSCFIETIVLTIAWILDAQLNQELQQRSSNLVDPYYAFNPDYRPVNVPSSVKSGVSACTCTCGDMSYSPPVRCDNPDHCINYCLQMYPDQCTVVNTYGCCGTSCRFFETQTHDTRYCTCNCADRQLTITDDKCSSAEACLTRCLNKFPLQCQSTTTQACCGQECQSFTQRITNVCACTCQGNTFYPAPKCSSADGCVTTCMTVWNIFTEFFHYW